MKKDFSLQLQQEVAPLLTKVANHPLSNSISSIDELTIFMQHHVFAVWDFMCLLKKLYQSIVCVDVPWSPPKDAFSANLIGSILLEEEADISDIPGQYASHFDIYVKAMTELGADTQVIYHLISSLQSGTSIEDALERAGVPVASKSFVLNTFNSFRLSAHELAASFVFGREAITGNMFEPIVNNLRKTIATNEHHKIKTLLFYLQRHIDLDGGHHFDKGLRMLENLCGEDKIKWQQVSHITKQTLHARLDFLDGILQAIEVNDSMTIDTWQTQSLTSLETDKHLLL